MYNRIICIELTYRTEIGVYVYMHIAGLASSGRSLMNAYCAARARAQGCQANLL